MAETTIEKEKKETERIKPIRLIDNETGDEYILDFDLEACKFCDRQGIDVDSILTHPATQGELFFFCAFRMHHKNRMPKEKTDKILWNALGGFNEKTADVFMRLVELYYQALGVLSDGEEENPRMTVEL